MSETLEVREVWGENPEYNSVEFKPEDQEKVSQIYRLLALILDWPPVGEK